MEKLKALGKLGLKYLYRYRRRYGFLLAALTFGFMVVTFITSAKDGMYDNVYYTAQSHYTGDLVAVGFNSLSFHRLIEEEEINTILEAADRARLNHRQTVLRTIYSGSEGAIYYLGTALQVRYVLGCDWDSPGESYLFSRMNFIERDEAFLGDEGIILSAAVAEQIGVRLGDRLTLEVPTDWGQRNTGQFIVQGIVQDSSIFGFYKVYISRLSLNRLMNHPDSSASIVGFFFDDTGSAEQKRRALHEALSDQISTGPLVYNREELDRETWIHWEGNRILLFTLPVYLSDVANLLGAMNLISYFLYGMMLVIILISAAVTYRLILHERTRELGVMRVIGFYGGDLRLILWIEIIILGAIALAAGYLLSWLLGRALLLVSFSWFPSFEIFLRNGRMTVLYLPRTMVLNVVLVFAVLFVAALIPSLRASKKDLPGLLSGEPI
ncbi:MAG: FtsX-like permease family protein [Treponema sp.]|nr:FtsX-like permease family protein [Treponema sp.]